MSKIETAVKYMINVANDNRHGYSQYNRWGSLNTWSDYDCSSLVISAYQYAGVPVKSKGATYTGNMYNVFLKCGFKDVTNQVNLYNANGMKRGDVLLNHKYHTAMYIGNYQTAEASIDERGGIVGRQTGDQTGGEILVRRYRNYPWNCVLRYVGNDKLEVSSPKPKIKQSSSNDKKFIKNENWYGVTQAICNVRADASTNSAIVAQYGKGERINYDSVYEGDGYRWISYIAWSGARRYVAYRKLSGDTTPWIVF
ncbi:SH3 domain-containing protein [Anaerococcus porci]|uniref:SH3 domain-containing protein n=1 Tax=Anaerococcus porci TaxID=2652269 RepID=UPI002A7580D2|nr:SH3 domain-containing protein [Anaerococcus porci]MDY3006271.1 SH3 domain-containing protein [Anaerococcus porci]